MMIYDNIFGGTSSEHRFYTSRLFTILLDYVLPDTETHPVIFVDSYEDIMLSNGPRQQVAVHCIRVGWAI